VAPGGGGGSEKGLADRTFLLQAQFLTGHVRSIIIYNMYKKEEREKSIITRTPLRRSFLGL